LHADESYLLKYLFLPTAEATTICALVKREHEQWQKRVSPPTPIVELPFDTSWWVSKLTPEEKRVLEEHEERASWERLKLVRDDLIKGGDRVRKTSIQLYELLQDRLCECNGQVPDGIYDPLPDEYTEREEAATRKWELRAHLCFGPRVSCDGMSGWSGGPKKPSAPNKSKPSVQKKPNALMAVNLFMDKNSQKIAYTRIKRKNEAPFLFLWSILRQRYDDEAWATQR
jgi:hypothetical protein